MMGRIARTFDALRGRGEKGLIVYLLAGDPHLKNTEEIILGLDAAGVDVVEVGVPFSDPTADGPIIQSASRRALQDGVTMDGILNVIESVRRTSGIPIVLFSYYNPIFTYGNERFAARAQEAGIDGLLVVDLPLEEASELRAYTDRSEIDFISLIAPTTSTERVRTISRCATGFLYFISITGVTGTAKPRVADITRHTERIREITDLPLVVGFGISTAQQAREIAPFVDGIVIGSAVVRLIDENRNRVDMVQIVSEYVKSIKDSIRVPAT